MSKRRAVRNKHQSRGADHFGRSLKAAQIVHRWPSAFSKLTPFAVGAIAATQRQAGETIELMGRSTQAKVGLFQQAVRAAREPNPFTSQAKWVGFWMSAFGLAQTNTANMLQIHGRAMASWLRLLGGGR